MDGIQMLDVLGGMDSEYVEEADEVQKPSWNRILALAAAACLCIAAGISWIRVDALRECGTHDNEKQESQEAFARTMDLTLTEECQVETALKISQNESAKPQEGAATPSNEEMEAEMINGLAAWDDDEMAAKTADYAVENGGCFLSNSLREALEQYGDEVRYRVVVEIFLDGVQVSPDGEIAIEETERLCADGYVVVMETLPDGESTRIFFTLHATAAQLDPRACRRRGA